MSLAGWRSWRIGRSGAPEFVGLSLIGLYMAAVGAFASGAMWTPLRYLYWQAAMLGGGVIAALIEPWLERVPVLARRPLLRGAAQALAMTPPITLYIALLSALMFQHPFHWIQLRYVAPSVLTVDIAVVILAWLIRRAYRKPEPRPVPAHAPPALIRDRLPPRLARAELHAVQAEDHYLRIHTSTGQELILMKLADALEALQACDGMQVHRSWWVSRHAVEHARWRKGRGELELKGGLKVPVSTRHAAAVKQIDWA
jgi:hypothetical protein